MMKRRIKTMMKTRKTTTSRRLHESIPYALVIHHLYAFIISHVQKLAMPMRHAYIIMWEFVHYTCGQRHITELVESAE